MKNFFNNYCSTIIIGILSICLLAVIVVIWHFTSQNGQLSHSVSIPIAEKIQNTLSDNLSINRKYIPLNGLDEFVRKGAHFCEYMLLGSITCIFLYVSFRKVLFSTLVSLFVCPICAFIDEYRQNFIPGRIFRWFDWRLDLAGAMFGILIATLVVLIISYIHKLKERVKDLEGELEQNRDRRMINHHSSN